MPRFTREVYRARGAGETALYDGVHAGVDLLDPEVGRDETALVVVVTDGDENASARADLRELARRVHDRTMTGRWTFVLLGPRKTLAKTAREIGVPEGNATAFESLPKDAGEAMDRTVRAISGYMDARARGVASSDEFYEPRKIT